MEFSGFVELINGRKWIARQRIASLSYDAKSSTVELFDKDGDPLGRAMSFALDRDVTVPNTRTATVICFWPDGFTTEHDVIAWRIGKHHSTPIAVDCDDLDERDNWCLLSGTQYIFLGDVTFEVQEEAVAYGRQKVAEDEARRKQNAA